MPPAENSMMAPRTRSRSASHSQPIAPHAGPSSASTSHAAYRCAGTYVAGKFPPGVESLGKVLKSDQNRQQHGPVGAGREHAAERQRFGKKVGSHGDELRRRTVALRLVPVEGHERCAAGQQQGGGRARRRQSFHAVRHEHERHRADEHAAPQGDDEVAQLLVQPTGKHAFDAGERGTEQDAEPGERRPQQ